MGVAEAMVELGRRPVRRRGRPDLPGQRRRDGRGGRQPRPARRSAAARPAAPGHHPPGADRSALGARPRRRARRCRPDEGLFLETTWRLHPDLCRFTSEVFYDDRLEPEPHLVGQRPDRRRPGRRRRAAAARRPERGVDNESPIEAEAVAALARSIVEGGALDRRAWRRARPRLGRRPDRRAVQRPGRRDQAPAAARRRGSGRSTSSRARRPRSASTR